MKEINREYAAVEHELSHSISKEAVLIFDESVNRNTLQQNADALGFGAEREVHVEEHFHIKYFAEITHKR